MRPDPLPPSLRDVADLLLMPGVSIYDMYPRLSGYDHVIYAFPRGRGDEWHVVVEPPVIQPGREFDETAVFKVETKYAGAVQWSLDIARKARRLGRSAIVVADSQLSSHPGGCA